MNRWELRDRTFEFSIRIFRDCFGSPLGRHLIDKTGKSTIAFSWSLGNEAPSWMKAMINSCTAGDAACRQLRFVAAMKSPAIDTIR
jgi:hypothetical protein